MKYSYVSYDWKQGGNEEDWEKALNGLGVYMTPDPMLDDSDTYAFFLTTTDPTPVEVLGMFIEEWGPQALEDMDLSEEKLLESIKSVMD